MDVCNTATKNCVCSLVELCYRGEDVGDMSSRTWGCICVTMCKNPSVDSSLQANNRKSGKFHAMLFSCTVELKVR